MIINLITKLISFQIISFNFTKYNKALVNCDTPEVFQMYLQDPATPIMEGILLFNKHLLFIVVMIVILTSWLLFNTIYSYDEFKSSKPSKFFHDNGLEIVWTSLPALILVTLASPSFSLLYAMDELPNPNLTVKILGHQWFWTYQVSDFKTCSNNSEGKSLKFASYMLSLEELEKTQKGYFRNLEVNQRLFLPTATHIRLLVSSVDVLHSWTIPSFGLKIDACPGRINQVNLFIKRVGVFFGQCSEICGVNHGFMPIVVCSLPTRHYNMYIADLFSNSNPSTSSTQHILASSASSDGGAGNDGKDNPSWVYSFFSRIYKFFKYFVPSRNTDRAPIPKDAPIHKVRHLLPDPFKKPYSAYPGYPAYKKNPSVPPVPSSRGPKPPAQ